MSESTKKTVPLLVSRDQAFQLVEWAEGVKYIPGLTRIVKQGRFAYFANARVAVRWDVEGLDVPDGSWIDLIPSGPDQGNDERDTLTNMANWAWASHEDEGWDLMRAARWRKPDGEKIKDFEKMFTRVQTANTPVAFDLNQLVGLSLVVTGSMYGSIALAPTEETGINTWWVVGDGKRVVGLCLPSLALHLHASNLPEAYQEKNKGGKK